MLRNFFTNRLVVKAMVVLNEVLSLNAQEYAVDWLQELDHELSSMKS